jgi:glycosyltransferase involved in cell wall biosynthesis
VVIPTFNRPLYLERALRSAADQRYDALEIIVVDDNDADSAARRETEALMERLSSEIGARRPLTYLRHQGNRGGGAARNSGAQHAQGAYLAFLDDDDAFEPDKTARQVALIEEAPAALGLVYSGLRVVDGEGNLMKHRPPKHRGNVLSKLALWNVIGTTSSVLLPAALFREVGGFDPAFPARQDLDLWFRIAERRPVDYVEEELTIHVRHNDARITHRYDKKLEARLRFFDKYRYYFDRHRRLKARYHFFTARFCRHHDREDLARRYLLRSLAAAPTAKALKALLGSAARIKRENYAEADEED